MATKDVVIDLAVAREPVPNDLLWQPLQDPAFEVQRGVPSRLRQVVELIIERVLAEPGGRKRLAPEKLFEIFLEDGIQFGILVVRTEFFRAVSRKARHEHYRQHHADSWKQH